MLWWPGQVNPTILGAGLYPLVTSTGKHCLRVIQREDGMNAVPLVCTIGHCIQFLGLETTN